MLDLPHPDVRVRNSAICHAANILNGDWRQERVTHYCMWRCPPGREADRVVRACIDLIAPNKPAVPALHRWGKQLPAYSWWLAGILVHRLILRSFGMLQSTLDEVEANPDMPAQAVSVARAFLGEDAYWGG